MLVKLMCLLFVVLVADAANLSRKCPHLKKSIEPDLEKLSGLWHLVEFYPEANGFSQVDIKRDGASYTITSTVHEIRHTVKFVEGVDEENRKVMKPTADNKDAYTNAGYLYLLAAEYDKFSILYSCSKNQRGDVIAAVLSRSKDVDEDTRKTIKDVLLEYPQLEELKDKFD